MQTTDGLSEFTIPSKSLNTSPRSIISLSRIELNLRNRKFVSEEGIGNLIKSLEIQLQRINLNVSLNKNCDDPNLRILEIVKSCVDEIVETKEKLTMNSFISNKGEHDHSQLFAELNAKVTAEKLNAANKQLKHYERLLRKKEKLIIEREEELNTQKEIIERAKEQLEITKSRLGNFEEKGDLTDRIWVNSEDNEKIKALARRLSAESQKLESQQAEIHQNLKKLEEANEKLERNKLELNELIDENNKILFAVSSEKAEIKETKNFIEKQKNEILEITNQNSKILDSITANKLKIKSEEESLLKQKTELEASLANFDDEKVAFARDLSELVYEKKKLADEKELIQQIKNKLNEERSLLKDEYNSLEIIKENFKHQGESVLKEKENELISREEELESTLIDLKIQIESFNAQIQEKEAELYDREEKIKEKEQNIKIIQTNLRLIEMSLIESRNQCNETQNTLMPEIENCYEELQQILKSCFAIKFRIENLFDSVNSIENPERIKEPILELTEKENTDVSNDSAKSKKMIEEFMNELEQKLSLISLKEIDIQRQQLENIEKAEVLNKAKLEFYAMKNKFEVENSAEKEKLKQHFSQIENGVKRLKNKENELGIRKQQLDEKESLLNLWESDFKSRQQAFTGTLSN